MVRSQQTPNPSRWDALGHQRSTLVALLILGLLAAASLAGPALLQADSNASSTDPFLPPSPAHWFGTDIHGRDVLGRVLAGSRLSLLVGAMGAALSLSIGVLWGGVAGYVGGRWEYLMMRVVDVLYSLPNVVFVMVAMTVIEPPLLSWVRLHLPALLPWIREFLLACLLGGISWLNMARIVRSSVQSLRTRAFVEASRALGASHTRILATHILPNIAGLAIACMMLAIPSVILYESFLSFLGLGVKAPAASLGTLIADGAAQLNPLRIRWWLLAYPSGVLAASLWALHCVGIGLSEALDSRNKNL